MYGRLSLELLGELGEAGNKLHLATDSTAPVEEFALRVTGSRTVPQPAQSTARA